MSWERNPHIPAGHIAVPIWLSLPAPPCLLPAPPHPPTPPVLRLRLPRTAQRCLALPDAASSPPSPPSPSGAALSRDSATSLRAASDGGGARTSPTPQRARSLTPPTSRSILTPSPRFAPLDLLVLLPVFPACISGHAFSDLNGDRVLSFISSASSV